MTNWSIKMIPPFITALPTVQNQQTEALFSGEEQAVFGECIQQSDGEASSPSSGGVLWDAGQRHQKVETIQTQKKKNNKKKFSIRCKVEYPFGYIKEKLDYHVASAKTCFVMHCALI